jgi:hypothetical protein
MNKSNEKVLIFYDKNKASQFEQNIEDVQRGSSDLIQIFESFQPYRQIKSLTDFETLVTDPLGMFDKTLQANSGINLEQSGGKIPNASVLASLYDIDRPSYMAILTGEKIIEGTCKPCAKLKVKQIGKRVLSLQKYREFEKYMIWSGNHFLLDEEAIAKHSESFNYYAETDAQIQCYNFWINATETLNELSKRGLLGNINEFSKTLNGRITYSFQANKLSVDIQSLLYEIQSLKNN